MDSQWDSFEIVLSNYRPVYVLHVFSKLLVRLVYTRLNSHVNDNNFYVNASLDYQGEIDSSNNYGASRQDYGGPKECSVCICKFF